MQAEVYYPKTKRGEKTFRRIIESAEYHIYHNGYHQTSIHQITTTAKVAPGTFYLYFKDKYSLYKYLLDSYFHLIRKAIAEAVKEKATQQEKERYGLKAFLTFITKHPTSYHIIWESLYINKQLFVDYYENFSKRYVSNLQLGQGKGDIDNSLDLVTLSYFLMGVSNFIGLKYALFEETTEEELEEVLDDVMKILEGGMFKKENK